MMKVNVTSRKLIKPSTPTPTDLQSLKLSRLDEFVPQVNVSVTLYYSSAAERLIGSFQESLAKILPRFYPLAGRYIKEKLLIDCSDEGAEYVEAKVDCDLVELMNTNYHIDDLSPCDIFLSEQVTDPLLTIQVSKFRCGGIAISISVSHRIFDVASLHTFVAAWTSTVRGDNTIEAICPIFNSSLVFPSKNEAKTKLIALTKNPKVVLRRFLFDKEAIASLRAKITSSQASSDGRQPSRILLVCALITKVFGRLLEHKKYPKSKDFYVMFPINIRERTVPPLPKYSCGNFAIPSLIECTTQQCQHMAFQDIVHFLRDGINKTITGCGDILSDRDKNKQSMLDISIEKIARARLNGEDVLRFTDRTKFRFYDADFGWGKPIWVSIQNLCVKNVIRLMEKKEGDGIEAWVNLEEEDMFYFQQDGDIKHFTG